MNLFKADFFRLFKSKSFYVLLLPVFLIPLSTCLMFPETTAEKIVFQGLDATLFCSVAGIMLALFVGRDYDDNTVRNKICYGETRFAVVCATFAESAVICLAFEAVSVFSSLVFSAIICPFSFTSDFAVKLVCQTAILLAFSTVVTAVTVCSESVKTGLSVSLLLSVILSAIGQILPSLSLTSGLAKFACRILYSAVSSNLVNSVGGTFVYTSHAAAASVTFGGIYLNAIILSAVYIALSVTVTMFVVKRQNYK